MNTSVTQQLGIAHPIIQGPFGGGLSSVELTSTVSNAGCLGSFGAHLLSPHEIEELCGAIRRKTDKPFAINLWVSDRDPEMDALQDETIHSSRAAYAGIYRELSVEPPDISETVRQSFEEQAEAVLRANPGVFSFVYGIPSSNILEECRRRSITTIGAATTLEEAIALEEAGVDMVLAAGFEAGGHRPSFLKRSEDSLTGTIALVPIIRDRVSIPVIAAGGISDARGVRAAFALGADAVQVGTAFLACSESNASEIHKQKLIENQVGETILSRAFTGRLARFLPNRFLHESRNLPLLPFPAQGELTAPIRRMAKDENDADFSSLYAGQSVSLIRHRHAADLINELISALPKDSPVPNS